MDYPNLLIAIRATGRPQYVVAKLAGLREARLSEIVRRGGAKPEERRALSEALNVDERRLFAELDDSTNGGYGEHQLRPPEVGRSGRRSRRHPMPRRRKGSA